MLQDPKYFNMTIILCMLFIAEMIIIQVILCTDGLANRGIGNLDGKP